MKKYLIVYNKIKSDILNGYLKYKTLIPSIRHSESLFGYSKTTIERAYDQLLADGYIIGVPGKGYFVDVKPESIKVRKNAHGIIDKQIECNYMYDFRIHSVSTGSFDVDLWKRYLKESFRDESLIASYGDAQGEYSLRYALCDYLYRNRGVSSNPEHILIGPSFQTLLFMTCSLLDANSRIGLEQSTSKEVLRVFESYGFECVLLSKEHYLEDLKEAAIDILYINTACFGKDMKPIDRTMRDQIIDCSIQRSFLILEDDYNGELTYVSQPRQALFSYSTEDNVIYFGSFSRLLVPSIRLSYVVMNEELKHWYDLYRDSFSPNASRFEQIALEKYIENGYLEKRLRKLKKEYAQKQEFMKEILLRYIPNFKLMEAYLCFTIDTHGIDEDKFQQLCQSASIGIDKIIDHQLRLSFATMDPSKMEAGISLLVKCIKQC
ncbi:PLP-dependent aminotransferase family protein [uncultured Faecalicoccus sp.]|uniref:aminotransferase-like domain-containing protein n=1 Tax=uncultured Faecalicoccus sp. TaxID=1971760 RepID=UPI00261F4A32|nr:PLP-dependent aminotransferase family protein [uncultured Faecalicoccus sp.]